MMPMPLGSSEDYINNNLSNKYQVSSQHSIHASFYQELTSLPDWVPDFSVPFNAALTKKPSLGSNSEVWELQ